MTELRHSVQRLSGRVFTLFTCTLLVATLVPQILNITPASADTGGYPWSNAPCAWNGSTTGPCSGYDWGESTCPSNDSYCTSRNQINGYYQFDQWGEGFRNCVSYGAWKLNQVFNINTNNWGNGTDWNNSALAAHYSDDISPQVGDIAQWNATGSNSFGHVAYVYAVNNGIASYAEYNYAADGNFLNTYTSASNSQGPPNNYIHIGTVSGSTPPPATPKNIPLNYNTEMDVYKRGSDNAIWGDTIQSGSSSWGGWHSLGGGLASNPAADQYGNEMDVFATNANGQLWQKTYQPSPGWGSWTQRASNMAGDPASIVFNGNLYVFSRGNDGNLYTVYWNGSSWVGPVQLSGNGTTAMGSSPTVTVYGSEMDVYIRGTDSNLWKAGTTDGVHWGSLDSMGGSNLENDPFALTYNSEMDVYANNTSGTLMKNTWNGSGWGGWNPLNGASFVGSPTALQYGNGEMDVYDRGMNDSYIYQDQWTTGWSGWASRGGNEQGDPTAIHFGTEMDVYATNYNNITDKDTWLPGNGGSWSGFTSLT